jgi:hypothetical protein
MQRKRSRAHLGPVARELGSRPPQSSPVFPRSHAAGPGT